MENLGPEADTLCAAHEPGGHVYGGRGSLWAGLRRGLSSRKMPPPRAASGFSRRSQQLDGVGGVGSAKNTPPWLELLTQVTADVHKCIFVFPRQQA